MFIYLVNRMLNEILDVSVRVYAIGILPPQPIPNKIRPIPKRKGMKEGEENNENALLL